MGRGVLLKWACRRRWALVWGLSKVRGSTGMGSFGARELPVWTEGSGVSEVQ